MIASFECSRRFFCKLPNKDAIKTQNVYTTLHLRKTSRLANVTRVRLPDSASRVGCGFVVGSRPCSERFFARVLWFSPLLKKQHFQIPIRCGECPYCKAHLIISSWNYAGAPNDGFLSDPLKRYFRLSGVPLKLCRFILGCAIIFLSVR